MTKTLFIVLFLILLSSCENPNKIKIIIPDGFQGVFAISEDENGIDVPYENGFHVFRVDDQLSKNLHVKFKTIKPLMYVGEEVVLTSSGKKLKSWPPSNEKNLDFHDLGINSEGIMYFGLFSGDMINKIRKDGQYSFGLKEFNDKYWPNE